MLWKFLQLCLVAVIILVALFVVLLDLLGYADSLEEHFPWLARCLKNRIVLSLLAIAAIGFLIRDFHDDAAWSGSFTQGGVAYNVTTSVSVSVAGNEDAALKTGAQNVIEIANDAPNNKISPNIEGGPDTGIMNINDVLNTPVAAHEFTHMLGVNDKSGPNLSNNSLVEGGWGTVGKATQQDFRWALGPVVTKNSWIWGRGGAANPDGSRTIGAPFKTELWWK
jgi:hypothetical protein